MAKFNVEVQLTGEDGNIFFIIGRATAALRRAGATQEQITEFQSEVSSSKDYYAALGVVMQWVEVA